MMSDDVSISEYHCCCDCKSKLSVPVNLDCTRWELICRKKRKEINHNGGITNCPVFEEEQ